MNTATILLLGFAIFATYMFFLLRMISKQHKLEKKKHPVLTVERSEESNEESRQAS